MKARFRSWYIRSSWIPPTCPVVHSKDNRKWAAMLGAKWQTTASVYYLSGVFHFEMTFTGGPGSLSPSLMFFSHIGKTHSPPTSVFIQTNIPDSSEETGGENTEDAVSPSAGWGPGGTSVGNLQFTVQEIRKYTHRFYPMENTSSLKQCWLITSWQNIQHHPLQMLLHPCWFLSEKKCKQDFRILGC